MHRWRWKRWNLWKNEDISSNR